MLFLSDLEEKLGSLDSVNMISAFDVDKFDMKSEMNEIGDIVGPYINLLSPIDKTIFDMFYNHGAKSEFLSDYLGVSNTAIYKRINALKIKLKLVIYLNMNKEELFQLINTYFLNDAQVAEYIAQFIFHRTSRVDGEEELDFKTIKQVQALLYEAGNCKAEHINNHTVKTIKRNNRRHKTRIKLKRIAEVMEFIIKAKAYRYNIFRGSLSGSYNY